MDRNELAEVAAHIDAGRLSEVDVHVRRVLEREPGRAADVFQLGLGLQREGRHLAAIAVYDALAGSPLAFSALINRGAALQALGRFDLALASFSKALMLDPGVAEVHANLAALLQEMDEPETAVLFSTRALALAPALYTAWLARGHAMQDLGRHHAMLSDLGRAVASAPDNASARYNHAEALLLTGDYAEGWQAYEWRFAAEKLKMRRPDLGTPEWRGEDIAGKTVLVCEEQGFGDTLQFIRLVPLLKSRVGYDGNVVLRCRPALRRLLAGVDGLDRVVSDTEPPPSHDIHISLLSLMARFGVTLLGIPANVPYLSADPVDRARRALPHASGAARIGIVWAGDPKLGNHSLQRMDARRSIPLALWAPLADVADVCWVSLQKGPAASQQAGTGLSLIDPMGEVEDFADTAAIIDQLDLVIGVDTAVIHLAGAMGKPVWCLSRFDGCWRWLLDREDSPWYPSLRLFRQDRPGDWASVIERVRLALPRFVADRPAPAARNPTWAWA